MYQYSDSEE